MGRAYVMDNEHRCILLMALVIDAIVVPFIHDHHLMLRHDNARPHVARICTLFLEAENIPAYSLDMSPIEHVGDALDRRIRQCVPVPANIQQLSHSHWRGVDQHSTGHNQQPDQLYAKEKCCTAWSKWLSHQILTGCRTPPDRPIQLKTAHFRVAFYCGQPKAHLCNNHAV